MSEPIYHELCYQQRCYNNYFEGLPDQFLNLGVRFNIESEIDEDKMLEAVRLTVKRLPYMSARIHKREDGEQLLYFSDEEPTDIELLDMTDKTEDDVAKLLYQYNTTPFPNGHFDTHLYRFRLLRLAGGKHTLYFCAHHITLDGYSMMYATKYIFKCYLALTEGTELPEPGISPIPAIEKELAYFRSPRYQKELDWVDAQFKASEPHFTSVDGVASKQIVPGKNWGKAQDLTQYGAIILHRHIPQAFVDLLRKASVEKNVSEQTFYQFGIRSFLAKVCETDDVTVGAIASRRSTVQEQHCGLLFAASMPCRTIVDPALSFNDALRTFSNGLREAYRHKFISFTEGRAAAEKYYDLPKDCIYNTIWFGYQAFEDIDKIPLKLDFEEISIGVASIPLYINFMPHDSTGDLYVEYQYAVNYTDPDNVERMHRFMIEFITRGLAQPDRTVKELSDEILAEIDNK